MFLLPITTVEDTADFRHFADSKFKPIPVAVSYLLPFKKEKQTSSNDFQNVIKKWESSFSQLDEVQKRENRHPSLEAPTDYAISRVGLWLEKAFKFAPYLNAPDIITNGDGGLDIEWEVGDKLISIKIAKSKTEGDRIYFEQGNSFGSVVLTEFNLEGKLNTLK